MTFFRIKRTLKLGFKSLQRHLLRSILTMLGIVFGVGAVVTMLAVGEGASYESQERIKRLGSQNIILQSVKPPEEEKATASTGRGITAEAYGLTYSDAERIKYTVPGVDVVIQIREVRQDVWNGAHRIDGRVLGTVPWYLSTTGQKLKKGRFINAVDNYNCAPVCVIGSEIARKLFPFNEPVGSTIKVGSDFYSVVGVLENMGAAPSAETSVITDTGTAVLIPLQTARARFGSTIFKINASSIEAETVELHEIIVRVVSVDDVVTVSEVIKEVLKRSHAKQDYEMIVPLQLLEELKRTARMFSIVLGIIASISLLVGGIGIMNIMLASVTERTREIGVRRALGAKKRDITVQFLTETVVLCLVGGVLGLGVGFAFPLLIELLTQMKVIFTAWSLILAFSISALVGIVFGLYPARRAANMDPIEALRHE